MKKTENREWLLTPYEKELLIKQTTEFINNFVPDTSKSKQYNNHVDKDIAIKLDHALTIMAIVNSATGLNIEPEK